MKGSGEGLKPAVIAEVDRLSVVCTQPVNDYSPMISLLDATLFTQTLVRDRDPD